MRILVAPLSLFDSQLSTLDLNSTEQSENVYENKGQGQKVEELRRGLVSCGSVSNACR